MTVETFFKELQRLVYSHPRRPTDVLNSENCELAQNVYFCKNLTYCFECTTCTDGLYLYDANMTANSIDCDYTWESQLCYEVLESYRCFNCEYLDNCAHMRDSAYCYRCDGCNNVFGCSQLKNKSFCVFNRQMSETEYYEAVKKYRLLPPEKLLVLLDELKRRYPFTQTYEDNNENTTYGNYIYYDKNCYLCFDSSWNENCGYLYDTFHTKNSFDVTYSINDMELCYEAVGSTQCFNCNYIYHSANCQDGWYILDCLDVKNSLGCYDLAHKQYCILNRQYSKEEYERISQPILKALQTKNLGWGTITI